MALIKYGGGVASMSGKQGGAVHGRGRTGATIRDWTKPCNPANAKQSQARARFGQQSAGWGNLTDAQRDSWNAFAQTQSRSNRQGDIYVPTGRQMYIELNANLKLTGQAAITAPPVGEPPPTINAALALAVVEAGGALDSMVVSGGAVDATVMWVFRGAPAQMTGRSNVNRQMRFLYAVAAGVTVDIIDPYSEIFGTVMPLGARVQIEVFAVTKLTGLASPKLTIIATATV